MRVPRNMKIVRLLLLLAALCLAPLSHAEGFLSSLFSSSDQQTFLAPDAAFRLDVDANDGRTLIASFAPAPSYYLYRSKVHFTVKQGDTKVVRIDMPPGELKHDQNLGDQMVFHQPFQANVVLDRKVGSTAQNITLEASYQGCSEKGLCYPPIIKSFSLALPAVTAQAATQFLSNAPQTSSAAAATESENSQIAKLLKQGNFWLILSSFFGAGVLLAFTPCMFPMIPILSGIIVGRGHKITHTHGLILSFSYVQGMAITYAAVGVVAGFTGTLLSNALQTPWALGGFALIFVLLALSMFGLYELQLPTALQSRLSDASNKLHGGHISGVFAMGTLSAIIVGPCVGPVLAGALIYIGQTHDALLGGSALYALALGMGVPLMLIGASAGTLLPKVGAWMESVKKFFGMLLLAVAIWIVSPILPMATQMLMWAALLMVSGIYLRALDPLPHTARGWHRFGKGLGIILLLTGVAYLVGALSGARDPLRPLGAIGSGSQAEVTSHLPFSRIKNLAELDARVAQAGGQPVMLDYYADWCVSCKEMERFTFSDPRVQAKLKNVVLLQADVTNNNADDKALLARHGLFGPPAILFFGQDGKELSERRVIGYQDAAAFLASLSAAGL